MNIKIENMMEEYNSIIKKIRRIKNEHRYEESQFETAELNMNKCLNSLEQLLKAIEAERAKLTENENKIFSEFRQEFPNVSDEDIYSSMEYEDEKQGIVEDRILCDKLENKIHEYIAKYGDDIQKIKQEEAEFKEKQAKLRDEIKQKILSSHEVYGNELGIIRSITKVNNKIVESIFDAGTRAEFELSKELKVPYNFYEDNSLYSITQKGMMFEGGNSFKLAEKCTSLREKDALAKRKNRIEKICKLLDENPEQYSQEGEIIVKGLNITITQKELIDVNLLPEKFGWRPLNRETDEVETTDDSKNEESKENTGNTKGSSFAMIEYKPKKFSKLKDFFRRIFVH